MPGNPNPGIRIQGVQPQSSGTDPQALIPTFTVPSFPSSRPDVPGMNGLLQSQHSSYFLNSTTIKSSFVPSIFQPARGFHNLSWYSFTFNTPGNPKGKPPGSFLGDLLLPAAGGAAGGPRTWDRTNLGSGAPSSCAPRGAPSPFSAFNSTAGGWLQQQHPARALVRIQWLMCTACDTR